MFACIHGPDANRLADSFSPFVEMVDEKTAVFTVTARQLGAVKHVQAQVALAATAEAAILAARNLPGYTFIAPGEEARVLGALSIDALPPDPELFETFHLWGIRSLDDLSRLPDDALASRLGARGLWLQRLARGAFERPLRPRLPAAVYEESAELEHPIKLREPLLFLIARFLHDLTARLKSQSLAAAALYLTLNGNQRTHSVPFPTRDVKLLLKLVEHSLERQPPEAPVAKLRLELDSDRAATRPARIIHAGRAGTGKTRADAGQDSRTGGREERRVSGVVRYASSGFCSTDGGFAAVSIFPSSARSAGHCRTSVDANVSGQDPANRRAVAIERRLVATQITGIATNTTWR